jgi:hypothetical protein
MIFAYIHLIFYKMVEIKNKIEFYPSFSFIAFNLVEKKSFYNLSLN